jgi:hypothetical protein
MWSLGEDYPRAPFETGAVRVKAAPPACKTGRACTAPPSTVRRYTALSKAMCLETHLNGPRSVTARYPRVTCTCGGASAVQEAQSV